MPNAQPIDAAPKTGEYFLACHADGSGVCIGHWDKDQGAYLIETGRGTRMWWIDDAAELDALLA